MDRVCCPRHARKAPSQAARILHPVFLKFTVVTVPEVRLTRRRPFWRRFAEGPSWSAAELASALRQAKSPGIVRSLLEVDPIGAQKVVRVVLDIVPLPAPDGHAQGQLQVDVPSKND